MALSQKDLDAIENMARRVMKEGKRSSKSKFQQTESRLHAYPILKQNIERYTKDIADVKCEDMRKSKDVVLFMKNSGRTPEMDIEDLRAGKILILTQKIVRDEAEISEIDAALETIKSDQYYKIIPMHYFEEKEQEEIANECHCNETTLWRNRKRLVSKISFTLYGADAL